MVEEVWAFASQPLDVSQGHDRFFREVLTVAHLLGRVAVLRAGEAYELPTYGVPVTAVGRVAEHPFYGVAPYHGEEVLRALAEAGDLAPLQGADDGVLVRLRELEELLAVPLTGVGVERAHALPVSRLPPEVGTGQSPVYVVHDPRLSGARVFFVAGHDPGRQGLNRIRLVQEKEREPRRVDPARSLHCVPPFLLPPGNLKQFSSYAHPPISLLWPPAHPDTIARGLTGEPVAPTNFKGVQKKEKRCWPAAASSSNWRFSMMGMPFLVSRIRCPGSMTPSSGSSSPITSHAILSAPTA